MENELNQTVNTLEITTKQLENEKQMFSTLQEKYNDIENNKQKIQDNMSVKAMEL